MIELDTSQSVNCFDIFLFTGPCIEPVWCLRILAMDGQLTLLDLDQVQIKDISLGIERISPSLDRSGSREEADLRIRLFEREVDKLAKREILPSHQRHPVSGMVMKATADALSLEFSNAGATYRFVLDIVCAANLMVSAKDALDPDFHPGNRVVH